MLTGSPIQNKGYYDVPICNQYSNKEIRNPPIYTNEYQLPKLINLTVNDNLDNYVVYQDPTIPSPSLYLETDQAMSGYYHKNPMSLAFDGSVPIVKKNQSKVYDYINTDLNPQLGIETFQNSDNNSRKIGNFLLIILIIFFAVYFLQK